MRRNSIRPSSPPETTITGSRGNSARSPRIVSKPFIPGMAQHEEQKNEKQGEPSTGPFCYVKPRRERDPHHPTDNVQARPCQ